MPPSLKPNHLTELELVKLLGGMSDSVNDDLITYGINAASDAIEAYCYTNIHLQTKTNKLWVGYDGNAIIGTRNINSLHFIGGTPVILCATCNINNNVDYLNVTFLPESVQLNYKLALSAPVQTNLLYTTYPTADNLFAQISVLVPGFSYVLHNDTFSELINASFFSLDVFKNTSTELPCLTHTENSDYVDSKSGIVKTKYQNTWVVIKYTSGWNPIPSDIQMIAAEMALRFMFRRHDINSQNIDIIDKHYVARLHPYRLQPVALLGLPTNGNQAVNYIVRNYN